MDTTQELIDLADKYNYERLKDRKTSKVDSYQYIDIYLDWYAKSKSLFAEYFDNSDTSFYDFCSFSTDSNGSGLRDNFTRQFPLFKQMIKTIEKGDHKIKNSKKMTNKCFLIHGHNEALKFEVTRLVERELEIEVKILHEQLNEGKTIIEKFEANSTVNFAIALWTGDDEGRKKGDENYSPRARQNVVLETGYFFLVS